MVEFIVEIQGFRRSSNLLQPKELAIINATDDEKLPTICLFQSPCKWSRLLTDEKKTNKHLERRFHGIPWYSGTIPFSWHVKILRESLKEASRVFCKGLEKKKFLEMVVPDK